MNLAETKVQIQSIKAEHDLLVKQIQQDKILHDSKLNMLEDLEEARIIFQKSAQITQKQISFHIENIVSHALAAVFDSPYEFKVDFVTRRNVTECDLLFIDEQGAELKPLESCGYGAADIASLALRVAYWKLSDGVRNTLILDEPARNLSLDKQPLASRMIRELSKTLNIQFLIVTHSRALAAEAEKQFEVTRNKTISKIKEI